jgi:hypothetical protein
MQMSQMHYLPLAPGFFAILVRAMAAIASTLCAAIMACGVASIRDLGPSDEGKLAPEDSMTANGPPAES